MDEKINNNQANTNNQPVPPNQASTPSIAPTNQGGAVMSEWPGAFGIYKISKNLIMKNVWLIIFLIILGFIASIIEREIGLVVNIVGLFVSIIISGALIYVTLESVKGNKAGFDAAFSKAFSKTLSLIGANLLIYLIAIISLILLIIPFFFIYPRISFAPYYIIDKDLSAINAIKASWNDSKGNLGKIYGIVLVNLLFALACIVLVGFYFLIVYYLAITILYMYITKQKIASS
jgi:hypothetical protein